MSRVLVVVLGFALAGRATGQEVPEARVELEFRLGGAEADEPFLYDRRPDVFVTEDGLVLVRRSSAAVVDVLDTSGRPIRSIGGRGEGPGELRAAFAHGMVGDTLWIRDFVPPTLSTFLLDGTYLDSETLRFDFGFRLTAPGGISGLLEGGRAYARSSGFVMERSGRTQVPVFLGNRELTEVQELIRQPNPDAFYVEGVGTFGPSVYRLPPYLSVARDGSAILVLDWEDSATGAFEVTIHSPDGSVVTRFAGGTPTQEVPRATRDSLIDDGVERAMRAHAQARRRDPSIPRDLRDLVEDGFYIPRFEPPVTRGFIGFDGSIWVGRDGPGGARWLAFDSAGSPRFRVVLPESVVLEHASLSELWATSTDALDIPYVLKYRIVEADPRR